ncbi:MAG: APC family permease [Candidatus Methanoplasma sp.]|jgi:amino acid transporter|nr:APC family permease [Candidatus Methanoplasma sp.]
MSEESKGCLGSGLSRSINWKQGMMIALGVPILILPAIYDVAQFVWAFSIFIWTMSVIQGFIQNISFGEMTTVFPGATGIPGCAQMAYSPEVRRGRFDRGRFIGAFCAWSYWFTWTPVVPVFTITMGDYLRAFVEPLSGVDPTALNLCLGLMIVSLMVFIGSRGLKGGALTGLLLALVSLVPMVIILIAVFPTGNFHTEYITSSVLPPEWTWSARDIVIVFGLFGLAQWCACAWETATIYGPEYKDPARDVPKALFSCGLICLVLYLFVSVAVFGALGIGEAPVEGVEDSGSGILGHGYATLVPIAKLVFGDAGGLIALVLLLSAMLLIIQTAFLGSSRTLYCMGREGNLPTFFSRTNKHGMPIVGLCTIAVVAMVLILIGNPVAILAASGMGFCIALSICSAAYVTSRTNPRFKDLPRPWSAPRGWKYVAACMAVYQGFVLLPCLMYWSYEAYGLTSVIVGIIVILAIVPIWLVTQAREYKEGEDSPPCGCGCADGRAKENEVE